MNERQANGMTDSGLQDAVVIERIFDAPAALVWELWTDPEHFKAWYGPDGAAVPVAKMDVRVGGSRLVCMEVQSPGGPVQMWFTGEYREVENELLVYTESMSDENGNVTSPQDAGMPPGHPMTTEVRVELTDIGDGRTKMVMSHVGVPGDSPGAAGWTMALDKLAARIGARSHS
jgi:uncharacterized protein YndB with AHSA1/START domain